MATAPLRMTGLSFASVSEISIRATEPSDIEAIHAILRCPRVAANTLQLPWWPLELSRQRFALPERDAYSFVAELDGRVVGNLGLHIEPAPRRRDVANIGTRAARASSSTPNFMARLRS